LSNEDKETISKNIINASEMLVLFIESESLPLFGANVQVKPKVPKHQEPEKTNLLKYERVRHESNSLRE
jgi:hypothetical protein